MAAGKRPEYYTQSQPGIRESLKAVRKNRPFLFSAGIFLFTWSAIDIIQVFMLYFLKYRMNLEAQSDTILGTIFITALVVLPLWNWISEKTDKRKAYVVGMIFLSAVMVTLIMLSPASSFAVGYIHCYTGWDWRLGGACAYLVHHPGCR